MKKLIALLFSFIFASSASAAIYKWVDKEGVVNFTDDESRVPSAYRSKIEIVNVAQKGPSIPSQTPPGKVAVNTQQGEEGKQVPPIAQTLIREGDFAFKLAEVLKIGQAKGEAEAESMLATVGVVPKNGWIADYPMTPIIIGQVRNAVVAAAASKKLSMGEDEALRALEGLTAEFGLAIAPGQYAESQPPTSSEFVPPTVIDEYYYDEGPPVVTYYPPPWDYNYLYGWVPYPFWCSGFFFPGFFILNDFHHHHGHHSITNHFVDPTTRASLSVDPTTRTRGTAATRTSGGTGSRGFASPAARVGATSISNRSANGKGLSQPGNTGRQYRGFQNPSTGSGRSFSRNFSSPSGRTFSSPSTGGRSSFGGFRSGGYSGNFQGARTGSGGSSSNRSFSSPSGRTFSSPSTGGQSSFGGFRSGGYSGGFDGGSGFGGSHGGGQGGGGGFSGNSQGGGGHGGGYGGGGGGGHR
jgi:hypothetical protein